MVRFVHGRKANAAQAIPWLLFVQDVKGANVIDLLNEPNNGYRFQTLTLGS